MNKMTQKAYERTPADKAADRKGAKKAGMSVAKWEKSAADRKADKAAIKKINAKRKGK